MTSEKPPKHWFSSTLKTTAFILFATCVVGIPFAHGESRFLKTAPLGGFAAFYCAGQAVGGHRDPYLVEPLLSCERALPPYHYDAVGNVEPAPLPPFVLVAFAPLARLPFGLAFALFTLLQIAAIAVAVWALDRLTNFGVPFIGAALLITALARNIEFGEVPPLVIGILCLAALLITRGRFRAGALVAAISLCEPHVAAPVLLAMFVAFPRTRLTLAAVGVLLGLVSITAVGIGTTVEYFVAAVPQHAAAEVWANDQYSLTWLLHQFGLADAPALRIGAASYLIIAALGIIVALRIAQRFERREIVVLLPAAFAMIGGTFIHDIQLPIAIPAAIVLLRVLPQQQRPLALLAVALLAVPWYPERAVVLLAFITLAILLLNAPGYTAAKPLPRLAWVASGCALYVVAILAIHAAPSLAPTFTSLPNIAGAPGDIASTVWGRFVRATAYGYSTPQAVLEKLAPECALLFIAFVALTPLTTRRLSAGIPGGADQN
jgi:hypothetical protein